MSSSAAAASSKADPTLQESVANDVRNEIKKAQKFKPAPGVEFVQYDEYGLAKNDPEADKLRKFISKDNEVLDTVVMAPPEVLEKSLALPAKGERVHMDKKYDEMDDEGKQIIFSI